MQALIHKIFRKLCEKQKNLQMAGVLYKLEIMHRVLAAKE